MSKREIQYLYKTPKSLMNKGTGFLSGYTHTLNPYTGCSFGCSYCYVRRMPVSLFRGSEWGTWVDVKLEASTVFRKELKRATAKGPVTIFMSSSTDPYQPIEYKEQITRSLLEVMCESPPDFILVQTRSPLVTRDIDLFTALGDRVRVSLTIETDLDEVRKHFSPSAPPIAARMKALQELTEAGIPTQAAIAPILPSSEAFASKLYCATNRVTIDDYFMGDGSGGKRTRQLGIDALYDEIDSTAWYDSTAYQIVLSRMRSVFPEERVYISQQGFEP